MDGGGDELSEPQLVDGEGGAVAPTPWRQRLEAYGSKLAAMHALFFMAIMLVASYAVFLPVALLAAAFPDLLGWLQVGPGAEVMRDPDLVKRLVVGGFAGPLLETILYQWLPIRVFRTWLKWPPALCVLISAVLFSAAHTFSIGYVIFSFLIGLVLAGAFVLRDYPGQEPGLIVFGVHSMRNNITTLVYFLVD